MRYRVTAANGASVEVDAVDWMMAMSQAIRHFGLEVSGWICDRKPNGDTVVTDSASGLSWTVRSIAPTDAPPLPGAVPSKAGPAGAPPPVPSFLAGTAKPRFVTPKPAPPRSEARARNPPASPALPASEPLPIEPPASAKPDDKRPTMGGAQGADKRSFGQRARGDDGRAPSPESPNMRWAHRGQVPPPSRGKGGAQPWKKPPKPSRIGPPPDLAERLFESSMDITGAADKNSACSAALEIALGLVTCEAGSVLRGTINDSQLTFVAVSGPVGGQLLGRKVPFGEGLVGVAFDLGITVQVNDVSRDQRHNKDIDNETGFVTRSILCVPIRSSGEFYGCLQLLNPPGRFQSWHIEVAETVSRTLAGALKEMI